MMTGSRWHGDDVIYGDAVSMRRAADDDVDDDAVIDVVGCDVSAPSDHVMTSH